MQTQKETPCIRCGKERIFKRKWKEVFAKGSIITYVETVCPDPKCQKIVDADFAAKRERRMRQESNQKGIKISNAATSPKPA